MQIGLMSVRAPQGSGFWEIIPSLAGRNRPLSFPTPPAAPRHGAVGQEAANPRRDAGLGGTSQPPTVAGTAPAPVFEEPRVHPAVPELQPPERFMASDPQVSVTQLLMNTNDSIIPAGSICSAARLQNGPRTD